MQFINPLSSYLSSVIAHRGASAIAPENTLAAFRKAKEIGAKWVEFDVMLTACGEAVVIHDETVDRTTNGHGRVADHPYSYLKTLDAGSWFDRKYVGEKIPTLVEVIALLHELNLAANIEIKPSVGAEEKNSEKSIASDRATLASQYETALDFELFTNCAGICTTIFKNTFSGVCHA